MALNTRYLSSRHGVIKLLQIVLGFVICSLLCANWYGGTSCFGEGRLGFASGLNFVVVIINMVIFVCCLLNIGFWRLERLYSSIVALLFLIAVILLIWLALASRDWPAWLIISTILMAIELLLFLNDLTILRGDEPNWITVETI